MGCRGDLGIDLRMSEVGAVGDSQPGDPAFDVGDPRGGVLLCWVDVERTGDGHRAHHVCRIAHGWRQRPKMAEQPGNAGRVHRNEGVGWLDSEHPAKAGRHTDRAAAVGAEVENGHAGCGSDSRATG